MLRKILFILAVAASVSGHAQSYNEELLSWRAGYKESLLHGGHALKAADTAYLRFYEPDPEYVGHGYFVLSPGSKPFLLRNMHGGLQKAVRVYGYVYFNMKGAALKLYVYKFLNADGSDKHGVFIPFTDRTNYKETFQGGRYLDVTEEELNEGKVAVDFNKCYNPHTAYERGYPYMIPPPANRLKIEIRAGEKIFGNNPGY